MSNVSNPKKKMNRETLQKNVVTAVYCALVIVMTFTPFIGYIRVGVVDATTVHIIVIMAAVTLGVARGTIVGTVWGLTCWLYAIMRGTPEVLWFMDFRVSVIPRILVGFVSALCFIGAKKLLAKTQKPEFNAMIVTGAIGTLSNTLFVLSSLWLFKKDLGATLNTLFTINVLINFVVEAIVAAILVPAVGTPVMKYAFKNDVKSK